jgi:N-acetyl-gamma-glutamyl-phosphate reductase
MKKQIIIIGGRGMVSHALKAALDKDYANTIDCLVIAPAELDNDFRKLLISKLDLVIIAVDFLASADIVAKLPENVKILDISPAFRTTKGWAYGLPEIMGTADICRMRCVANPGCFATSALLLLAPVTYYNDKYRKHDYYLDGVGGFTTGGRKMMEKFIEVKTLSDMVYSLDKEHLHIPEIKYYAGVQGTVIFTPKIADVHSGIRMQTFIPDIDRETLLGIYERFYYGFYEAGTNIIVDKAEPNKIAVDEMAHTANAKIRVYQKGTGCLVVCTMDNLGKGAVDSALTNMKLMLGL